MRSSSLVLVFLLFVHASAGCGGNDKLIDTGGMPRQLAKLKCGSSEEDVVRAYPEFTKDGDMYGKATGKERLAVQVKDGKVTAGMVFDLDAQEGKFGKRLEQLEGQLGKGTVREGAKNKILYWEPRSGPVERAFLEGTNKTITLAAYCRSVSDPDPQSAIPSKSAGTAAPPRDTGCDTALSEYQLALGAAGDSAGALERTGCAKADAQGTLIAPAQLSSQCQTLWNEHLVNAQHAIDLNGKARTACPDMKLTSMGAIPASLRIDPNSVASDATGSAAQPNVTTKRSVLTADSVRTFVKSQADSLTSTGAAFIESFDANAVAFFPQSLTLYEGRDKIIDGSRAAWGQGAPENVDAADVVVGVFPNFAWATTQWKITLADKKTVLPIRVTEVLSDDPPGSLRVVAASFSVAVPTGKTGIVEPAPAITSGGPPTREPDVWLASPSVLANHVHGDLATTVLGSDAKEFALGADESRILLGGWRNVKLEFVGNARSIDGAGFRVVLGYARLRGAKPTLFRVLGLFVPGDAMAGAAPWELGTAHYSVAIPSSPVSLSNLPTTGSRPADANATRSTNGGTAMRAGGDTDKPAPASPTPVEASAPKTSAPVEVYVVAYSPKRNGIAYQAIEDGNVVVKEGPAALTVIPGRPRTIVLRGRGWKDKPVVLDGSSSRVEVTMELSED